MTELILFGLTLITPESFAGLTPPERTELVLIMLERGADLGFISDVTGCSPRQLDVIAQQTHAIRLGGEERIQSEEARAAQEAGKRYDIPPNAVRVLLWLAAGEASVIKISLHKLEQAINLASGSAEYAVECLLERRLIRSAEERRRGRQSSYIVTRAGRDMAARLLEGVAA